ncbi:MAG: MoaD/ThiS family protein [bacterium]
MVVVRIPSSLGEWFRGQDEVRCEGATVAECIEHLDRSFPGLKARLLDQRGEIASALLFLNGDNIRHLGGLATPVREGDELGIIPLAAGG